MVGEIAAGNALLVIDTGARRILKTIELGASPDGVALSPDGSLIAAASEAANAVVLIDASGERLLGTVRTAGRSPAHVAFDPKGRTLYVFASVFPPRKLTWRASSTARCS